MRALLLLAPLLPALLAAQPGAQHSAPAPAPIAGAERARAAASSLEQVRAGVSVSADTVTVGTPFLVQVRVRAPAGAAVEFPPGPDTSGVVQPLDPPQLMAGPDSSVVDRTVRYRLAAWDVGLQEVELGRVVVRSGASARELAVGPVAIFVASVLPADSAERVPRPARPPISFPRAWWIPWLIALVAAAIVGLLIWWYVRRRRGRPTSGEQPLDALVEAERRFRQVDSLGLPEAGESGLHVALTQEILREYLARRIPEASESLTSRELLHVTTAHRELPVDRLEQLLGEGDLVKFAARPVSPARARELGRESEALVRKIHESLAAAAAGTATSADGAPPGDAAIGSAA